MCRDGRALKDEEEEIRGRPHGEELPLVRLMVRLRNYPLDCHMSITIHISMVLLEYIEKPALLLKTQHGVSIWNRKSLENLYTGSYELLTQRVEVRTYV
jgi:hypothetical protein